MEDKSYSSIAADGFWNNNAVFAQLLGMCPLLAVTSTAENGIAMGLASMVVLIGANFVVSLIRHWIPREVRIPAYIVVIARFVTVVDLTMNAYVHDLHKTLGLFIPLIVVNCAILGRAEAFASKTTPARAAFDGVMTGLGFTFALFVLGAVREVIGMGTIFGVSIFGGDYIPVLMMILPPGAFIALGFILAGVRIINDRREAKRQAKPHPVENLQVQEASA